MRRLARSGDPAGFVRILDEQTLLLPDRPGNRLADSLRNILENPHVALLFVIPGVTDTFRVNGRAEIVTDPELLEPCAVEGKAPKLALRIEIDEAYTHCSKAFLRAKLWDPERTSTARELPRPASCCARSARRSSRRTYDAERAERYAAPRRLLLIEYRFVDCAYALDHWEAGRDLYLEAHIPGAAFLGDRSSPTSRSKGRAGTRCRATRTSPPLQARAGIGEGVFVVAYDHGGSGGAARLWWLLRHYGHEDVAVLRGGFDSWLGPVRGGEEEIEPREFVPRPRDGRHDRRGGAARAARRARAWSSSTRARPERYRGEVEPIDPVAGRIPGAVNWSYGEASDAAGDRRRGRDRRLLRLGDHRLRRPARCSPRPAGRTRSSTRARGATGAAAACRPKRARSGPPSLETGA